MSMKKTLTIVAAAGALAAISVPAMAFENEFHGTYTFNGIFSNFAISSSADTNPVGPSSKQMNNYFEQRARLQYIAKASDDLKLVTHFEMDTRFGGVTSSKYTNSTDAGVLDADGINLETKHVYLDANLGKSFNLKTGIMPYKDTIKGLFIDADVPAIVTTTKLGAYTLGLGFSRFADDANQGVARLGDRNKDLFIWDNVFAVNKDTKAAFSYYFLADYANQTATGTAATDDYRKAKLIHTLGLSAETKLGGLGLSGFFAMQAGHQKNAAGVPSASKQYHGWAGNVAAKMAVGPGTAKTAFLFTSGDNTSGAQAASHYHGWYSPLNSYNESGLMIMARNTGNSPTNTDNYIRKSVTNIALLTMGYDASLTKEIYANANVGFGWTPASGKETSVGTKNSSDFMGTELNLEGGYKVSDNLTLRAQAAYLILGGLYKNTATDKATSDPENPYTMRLLASFKF